MDQENSLTGFDRGILCRNGTKPHMQARMDAWVHRVRYICEQFGILCIFDGIGMVVILGGREFKYHMDCGSWCCVVFNTAIIIKITRGEFLNRLENLYTRYPLICSTIAYHVPQPIAEEIIPNVCSDVEIIGWITE